MDARKIIARLIELNKPEEFKLSDRAIKIRLSILKENVSVPIKTALLNCFSALLEESFPPVKELHPGSVFLLTTNTNSHNYPLNVPILLSKDSGGRNIYIRPDGTDGNDIGSNLSTIIPASPEQIKQLTDLQLVAFSKTIFLTEESA